MKDKWTIIAEKLQKKGNFKITKPSFERSVELYEESIEKWKIKIKSLEDLIRFQQDKLRSANLSIEGLIKIKDNLVKRGKKHYD